MHVLRPSRQSISSVDLSSTSSPLNFFSLPFSSSRSRMLRPRYCLFKMYDWKFVKLLNDFSYIPVFLDYGYSESSGHSQCGEGPWGCPSEVFGANSAPPCSPIWRSGKALEPIQKPPCLQVGCLNIWIRYLKNMYAVSLTSFSSFRQWLLEAIPVIGTPAALKFIKEKYLADELSIVEAAHSLVASVHMVTASPEVIKLIEVGNLQCRLVCL